MTIVPHDHRARASGRQRVAGMTGVLGDSLFSSDFYCPLYPSVYRALLRAWQEQRTQWGPQTLIFHPRGCRSVCGPHPSLPWLCMVLRPRERPERRRERAGPVGISAPRELANATDQSFVQVSPPTLPLCPGTVNHSPAHPGERGPRGSWTYKEEFTWPPQPRVVWLQGCHCAFGPSAFLSVKWGHTRTAGVVVRLQDLMGSPLGDAWSVAGA